MALRPYADLDSVWASARQLGEATVYGKSVEGRDLLAVTVPGPGPTVLVTAGLHGIEYIGVHTALEVLRRGGFAEANLVVCPVLNPDGYARTWREGGAGPVRDFRKNARGVDLNRNFPMPYGAVPSRMPFTGSADPDSATYRGPEPLSEPEAAALADFVQGLDAHVSANLHSFMGTLIAARVWHRPDWQGYTEICAAFRAGQGTRLGYPRLATPLFDVFTGELEDWQHHVLRCWSVCVECFSLPESLAQHLRAPSGFWRFNPRDPDRVAERDAAGVRAMLSAALARPRPPARPGALLTGA